MEKSAAGKLRKWLIGLLAVFGMSSGISAQPTYEQIRNLRFKQKDEYIFSLTNVEFYVDVENVLPNTVTVYMNSIPDNVELISVKKETYIPPLESTNSTYGTHIVVTVRFLKSGNFNLFGCDVQIKSNFYKIYFNPVHVYDNIQVIKPELSVSFQKDSYNRAAGAEVITVAAGTHIQYTVYVQFASDVQSVSWSIPENSLFEEIAEYDVPKVSDPQFGFSSNAFPVATFDWCPLTQGMQKLPPVSVVTTALSGAVTEAAFPSYTVQVTKSPSVTASAQTSSASGTAHIPRDMEEAFSAPDSPVREGEQQELSPERMEAYRALLLKEHHSFPPFSGTLKNRRAFEKENRLPLAKPLPSLPVFYALLFCLVALVAAGAVCMLQKKYRLGAVCLGLLLSFGVVTIVYGRHAYMPYALSSGGELLPIPEKDCPRGVHLQNGTVISVKKHTGDWLYVQAAEASGWMRAEHVIFIE